MKKIIAFIAFLFLAVTLIAQDKVITNYGLAGQSFENNIIINGAVRNAGFATHKLLHNSAKIAAYNYTFQLNVPGPYFYSFSAHLRDFEAGTANTATVILKGSLDNYQYIALDTLTYSSVADSMACIAGSETNYYNTTGMVIKSPLAYKYLRIVVTPTGDSIWVKSLWLNVLPIK
jgi:hypothetical protein